MSSGSKLHYGERFGEDVNKLARKALAPESGSTAAPKYTRWFHGESGEPEPMATSAKKFRKITADMAMAEIIAATRENLSILGDDAGNLFIPKLPAEHKLRRAIRSSVLQSAPHLGTCKFGEIVTDMDEKAIALTQIFIANFDGDLDVSQPGNIYRPKSRGFDQMFFGLHLIVDRSGNPLGFNRARGDNGIAFKTKDLTTALYNIASESTGLSIEALQERAAAAARKLRDKG